MADNTGRPTHDAESGRLRLFPMLPSVNDLLVAENFRDLITEFPHDRVVQGIRELVSHLRAAVQQGVHSDESLAAAIERLPSDLAALLRGQSRVSLRPVINATGVLLHTNLGRAPLSEAALAHLVETARGYCNLEFDLIEGQRSSRDHRVESLLLRVLASRAAISPEGYAAVVVNNCAAATVLALNSVAEGGEVIVSRGELVEIGGGFRVPDILRKSGATLREVGTTNRTRIGDYAAALGPHTRMLLRVHQSNFSMEGFTGRPALSELVELGKTHGVPVFEDQGTGSLLPVGEFGIATDASFAECFRSGPDLLAASGDKLLGGPQCGLLVGRAPLIEQVRQNPLLRAFRADKLTYAALEATLLDYLSQRESRLPLIRMLRLPPEEVRLRCEQMLDALAVTGLHAEICPAQSVIGGGTTPGSTIPSYALALRHDNTSEAQVLALLRRQDPPVIARVAEDRVLLDLRTVDPEHDQLLLDLLRNAFREPQG